MIQAKAQFLAKKVSYQAEYLDIENARFSQKWVDGFMSRHKLVNKRKMTVARRLPKDYIEQHEFLSYILYLKKEYDYPLALIGNMDETLMAFNLPIVLTCMADGTKLPSVIIFKFKKIPREEFPDGVIIRTNPKGWMNENEMLWWQRFREKRTDLAVIPGGLTSHLQPLDVSLNRSFKSKVRNIYNNWMSEAIKDYTSSGKIKRPSYSLVARWVKEGWDAIDINMIRRSFKYCSVSNAMDGIEDTLIFDFDQLEHRVRREDPGREVEGERNENDSKKSDSEESDPDYDKSESEESDKSEISVFKRFSASENSYSEGIDAAFGEGEVKKEICYIWIQTLSEIEDSDESESGNSIESESGDSNKSETEENYYKENEEQIVIQDWK
ncbi:pogo transposable element with KRAB domain [Rhizophagus irregularis DAOM 181602=DAOM 197198]|nr:pogo transposable element with KRAB domain [Rhizophagus irregularis DAOM 181602=DAOM 197198]